MHGLHQYRRRGGGRCEILRVPKFSTWQTWQRGNRHQEATSAIEKCIHQKTKLRILNWNFLFVLLYGAKMWRVTATDLNKLDVFHRTCLRRVLRRFWSNHLSNEELYEATGSAPVSVFIRVRRWRWLGHVLRKSPDKISRTALKWAR